MKFFQEVNSKKSVDEAEKEILDFWETNKIFKKSLELREGAERYSFYDGPPFATGTPHYGHLVASAMKDAVPRYWAMRGKYVERKWGWDCHGLPIENIVEKEMGSKSKKDIEAMGIGEFNDRCRSNVLGYVDEWRRVISRFGRWADMDDAYRTMDPEYMESVWWVFGELWKKGWVYEGYRSMHICPRCETTLSQSEVAEGYKDVKDLSVVVKFELISDTNDTNLHVNATNEEGRNPKSQISNPNFLPCEGEVASLRAGGVLSEEKTYILAWTTTPWTLLGNVALAVSNKKETIYVKFTVKSSTGTRFVVGETYILLKETLLKMIHVPFAYQEGSKSALTKKPFIFEGISGGWTAVGFDMTTDNYMEFSGEHLIGLSYKPLFDVSKFSEDSDTQKNGWKIYGADFVTTEDGTGVVHIAPAFGTDDMNLGKSEKLPFIQHIGMDGIFSEKCGDLAGLDVKPRAKDKPDEVREADITMLKKLKDVGAYFSHEKYLHSYPHCWRCDTALLNYATSSWFVAVEKMKERAMANAKGIRWVPEHIKEGRFGKWLEGARDWSVSRQRFWASVMPIWKCEKCSETRVVSSVMDIAEELGGVNRLYLVRHGEAYNNTEHFLDSKGNPENHLTEYGREQIAAVAQELKEKKVDVIVCSPMLRTRESAEILSQYLGAEIIEDERLREIGFGSMEGMSEGVLREKCPHTMDQTEGNVPEGVETVEQLKKRSREFLEEINIKYRGKTIVIVSHADPIFMIHGLSKGYSDEELRLNWYPKNGELRSIFSKKVDLHRPHIDEVVLHCQCGGAMKRIPDVLDTWFDSGSMPYAQMHYPFENVSKFEKSFPAEFIAEGVDQTRCWFYYLHVLATGVKESKAFQNVIVNGIVQAEDGKKMAKKLKNYPDPSIMMQKYGSDVLRMYLLSSPVVMAENLNFSERELGELSRGMFRMLRNTYAFFTMYANVDGWKPSTVESRKSKVESRNLLDRWILSEFNVLVKNVNEAMEKYELAKATRFFMPFVDDLSNWYVRRSRRRFWKSESDSDKQEAYETLYFVLVELSKLLAPFAPFVAEEMYRNLSGCERQVTSDKGQAEEEQEVGGKGQVEEDGVDGFFPPLQRGGAESSRRRGSGFPESVHFCDYPQVDESMIDEKLIRNMIAVREIVTIGLQKRAEAKIKVRQPLESISLGLSYKELFDSLLDKDNPDDCNQYNSILREELNVKRVSFNLLQMKNATNLEEADQIILDTNITPDLKLEGQAREIVRAVQEMRKSAGYKVEDRIVLGYTGMEDVFLKFGEEIIAKETLATIQKGTLENSDVEQAIRIDDEKIILLIKR